jgi:hypothetical protein
MSVAICPRCRKRTERLEVFGTCEHCQHSALVESAVKIDPVSTFGASAHNPSSCVLCGSADGLKPFYLRTHSVRNEMSLASDTTRHVWRDFRSACCRRCYWLIAWMQTARRILLVIQFALLLPVLFLVAERRLLEESATKYFIAIGVLELCVWTGLVAIFLRRQRLVNRPHVAALVLGLIAEHETATEDLDVTVIPLATTSESVLF